MPIAITYSALISAHKKGQQPECALEAFQAMQQQRIAPNVITCSALLSALEESKCGLMVFQAM